MDNGFKVKGMEKVHLQIALLNTLVVGKMIKRTALAEDLLIHFGIWVDLNMIKEMVLEFKNTS
jgi:hypothetical protein